MDYIFELLLYVGYPKRYAIPSFGDALPQLPPDASLNDQVPIWMASIQCLIDEQTTFAAGISKATGLEVRKVVAQVRFAGWKDDACVALVIHLWHTNSKAGKLMPRFTAEMALRMCEWLRVATDADWVVAQNAGHKIQVESRGD